MSAQSAQSAQKSRQPFHKQDDHGVANRRTSGYANYGDEFIFIEGIEVHALGPLDLKIDVGQC